MKTITRSAPAKLNLMLAITGLRGDGFHELISLVAPISLNDTITAEFGQEIKSDSLVCDTPGVPTDDSNLVLKATNIFRKVIPTLPPIRWTLQKRVPHGAGLGGGSSDAASALMIMNEICNGAPGGKILRELAGELGSDCILFLDEKPVIMCGRGEHIYSLTEHEISALRGRKFLLFKPAFGISTAEVYGAMKRNSPRFYTSKDEAEKRLATWRESPEAKLPLFNNMELPVFEKYVALPTLFEKLRLSYNLNPHMSGSGSACFAEISDKTNIDAVTQSIRDAWGATAFVTQVKI